MAEHNGVRVNDEEANAGGCQQIVNAGGVGAFRQPDAARLAPEMLNVISLTDFDLGAARFGAGHQRQKTVRCAAGDNVYCAGLLKRAKAVQDVAMITVLEHVARGGEVVEVHVRRGIHRLGILRAHDLFFAQLDELIKMVDVTLLQERIGQHLAQRRRQSQRHARPHAVEHTAF